MLAGGKLVGEHVLVPHTVLASPADREYQVKLNSFSWHMSGSLHLSCHRSTEQTDSGRDQQLNLDNNQKGILQIHVVYIFKMSY